jgi:hypothetical protein
MQSRLRWITASDPLCVRKQRPGVLTRPGVVLSAVSFFVFHLCLKPNILMNACLDIIVKIARIKNQIKISNMIQKRHTENAGIIFFAIPFIGLTVALVVMKIAMT